MPLADVLFAVTFKVYSNMSARRFASDMRDAQAKGYVSKMPSFNSIFDYLQMPELTAYLKYLITESALPLKSAFAVDSSGFSTTRFVRWFDVKYGNNEDWHDWIKMHLTCGTSTHIVTSVELSSARMHDSPYFQTLIEQTAKGGFNMKEVSADKGYISADNLQTVVDHGATPYIPFKTNVTGKRGSELWKKLFHYYSFKREEFLTHYHRRSNVETTFSMIKAKFGERLRSKTETAVIKAIHRFNLRNLWMV